MLRPSKFIRGVNPKRTRWAATEAGFAPSLFFDEGKQWGRSGRLISPNLVGKNITAMIPYVSKIGERLCDKFGKRVDLDEVVDVRRYFEHFTHDIISLAAFGVDVDSTSASDDHPCRSFRAIESSRSTMTALSFEAAKIFQWKYLSNVVPWIQRFKKDARHLNDVVKRTIDAARNSVDGDASTSGNEEEFAGTLLRKIISRSHADTENDRMKFSDDEVVNQVKTLFVVGTDTTALALSWAMYYLVKNPMAFARCGTEGLSVAPSRWIESERVGALLGKGVEVREQGEIHHNEDAFFGFGCGPRVCPGKDMAKVEATMIIAAICSRFDVSLAPCQVIRMAFSLRGTRGELHPPTPFRYPKLSIEQSDPPEEELQFTVGPAAVHLNFKRKHNGGQA